MSFKITLFLFFCRKMSTNGEDSVDGTLEKKEEALVEAVKEVKIKDDVKEDGGGKKNDEETGKKSTEPGDFHWRKCLKIVPTQ